MCYRSWSPLPFSTHNQQAPQCGLIIRWNENLFEHGNVFHRMPGSGSSRSVFGREQRSCSLCLHPISEEVNPAGEFRNEDELFVHLSDAPLFRLQSTQVKDLFLTGWCSFTLTFTVQKWLERHFPEKWIGRRGPVDWPARLPDHTPLDFYVWSHLKHLVYASKRRTRVN